MSLLSTRNILTLYTTESSDIRKVPFTLRLWFVEDDATCSSWKDTEKYNYTMLYLRGSLATHLFFCPSHLIPSQEKWPSFLAILLKSI